MRGDNFSGLREGLELNTVFLAKEAENAFLTRGIGSRENIYPAEYEAVTSGHKITALFGANQCLRVYSQVLMADGSIRKLHDVEVDDWVMAFDFTLGMFVPSRVNAVYHNARWMVVGYKSDYGTLECTRSHKVLTMGSKNRFKWMRVNRAAKAQLPVIVHGPAGQPMLAHLEHGVEVGVEETMDLCIDHPDHAFVCDGMVVSNSGKTLTCAHRLAWDATGLYPEWYDGPKTTRGIDAWVIGDTGMNVRDSYQKKLFGPDPERPGWTDRPGEEALIPARYIMQKPSRQSAPAGLFDSVRVKHVPSDTTSLITQKSHQMDQQSLASWTGDRVFIDEECPLGIVNEMIARILVRSGQIFISLCPLGKYPDMVNFLLTSPTDLVKRVKLGHDQVKHLSPEQKASFARLFASNPAELAARTRGDWVTNTGLIFPFPIKDIIYDPAKIHIPSHAVYLGGMDVGWTHPTAAVALALDRLSDVAYCYASYAQAGKPYTHHHSQLLTWGDNMTFMIDCASDQSSQADGTSVLRRYWELAHPGRIEYDGENHYKWEDIDENKRKYIKAERAFQVTMDSLWHRFETGRVLVNQNLRDLLAQYNNYTWNKDGTGPRPETPTVPLDIITAMRLGAYHLPEYAHRLDQNPPWMADMDIGDYPDPPEEWNPYRCGRE